MGGLACAQLIIDGNDALAIIDANSTLTPSRSLALLKHRIVASCQLVGYESTYLEIEDKELPASLTDPIDAFHKEIFAHFPTMSQDDITKAAIKIGQLNNAMKDYLSTA